jgi:hypothetical protein
VVSDDVDVYLLACAEGSGCGGAGVFVEVYSGIGVIEEGVEVVCVGGADVFRVAAWCMFLSGEDEEGGARV